MECVALLLLLTVMCWLQQSGGTCTLDLLLPAGSEKLEVTLDCPTCQFSNTQLNYEQSCDPYSDFELEGECPDTSEECRKTYFLQNSSTASSNAKTDVADPDTMIFEESVGECSTVMLAMGAVIGILAVLLGIVLTGWVWTCWKLKKVAKRNSPQVNYRINSYEENIPSIDAPPTDETTPPPPPVYAIPNKKSSYEPKYEKLALAQSLPSLDLSGLGYDVPVKRQPKLKPPIKGDFIENATKGTDEYHTLKYAAK